MDYKNNKPSIINEDFLYDYDYKGPSLLEIYINNFDINSIPLEERKRQYIDYEPLRSHHNESYWWTDEYDMYPIKEGLNSNDEEQKYNEKETQLLKATFEDFYEDFNFKEWQFLVEDTNNVVTAKVMIPYPIDSFGVIISDKEKHNLKIVDFMMKQKGYFRSSKVRRTKDDYGMEWAFVLYDPVEQYCVNNLIKSSNYRYFIHSCPIIYKKNHDTMGIKPIASNSKHKYIYPERVFFGISDDNVNRFINNRRYYSMMCAIADEYKDKNPTRAFVIYKIPIKDIIYEVKFYRDIRSNNGFYTNQWIDPKYLTNFLIYDFVR